MAEHPIPKIKLDYAFSVRVDHKKRIFIQGPTRSRDYVPPAGGEIWGPRLQGKVVPYSGGDYAHSGLLDSHYMLQAEDGAWIYLYNTGYMYPKGGGQIDHNDPTWDAAEDFYYRLTPYFDAPFGPHQWLTRTIMLGTAKRFANPDHTIFTYYAVL
ncbi:MAG TPA: DUF3237 domain-containing protein [Alphaproteobacteria bacterium]|nr:DUF3237 domain-containing protein [Alphaproteobacteria bacterium]